MRIELRYFKVDGFHLVTARIARSPGSAFACEFVGSNGTVMAEQVDEVCQKAMMFMIEFELRYLEFRGYDNNVRWIDGVE